MRRLTMLVAFAATSLPAAQPQPSATCQFAIGGWVETQMEIQDARRALRDCQRDGHASCSAEDAQIRALEQRAKLLRRYVERYCSR